MAIRGVVPTKTKLLNLQREMGFAQQGHDLLEQKKQILVMELMRIIGRAEEAQRKADEALAKAYHVFARTLATMGKARVKQISQAVTIDPEIRTHTRSVMGVPVPQLELDLKDQPPYFAHGGASLWMDESVDVFKEVLKRLTELAETKTTALRLAREVSKTLRRVNALEKIYIPDRKEQIAYIQTVLEEAERERFSAMKIIKNRLNAERGGDQHGP